MNLYKKLLFFVSAFIMTCVMLLPSTKVKAANELYTYDKGMIRGSTLGNHYHYNESTKTLTLYGGVIDANNSYFIDSYVNGLKICVELDTTIYGGFYLNGSTKITGPGKLTIVPREKGPDLPFAGIYMRNGGRLVIDKAYIDITAIHYGKSRFGGWAILGNNHGEELYVRDSEINVKAQNAAISYFNGGINFVKCGMISPSHAVNKGGDVYKADEVTLAKEVQISKFYVTQQPAWEVTGAVGDYVTMKVEASLNNARYQWQRYNREKSRWESVSFSGAQTNTLRFQVSENMYSWRFRCVITYGGLISLTSDDCNLKVVAKITSQPASTVYVNSGSTATLSVTANGTIMNYTWQYYNQSTRNWVNLTEGGNYSNVRTSTLKVKGNSSTHGIKFRCAVRNKFGYTVYTNGTTLSVR